MAREPVDGQKYAEKAYRGGFLGFLGCLGFVGVGTMVPERQELSYWALLACLSLLAFIPAQRERIRFPIVAARARYLNFLGWLTFLGFLFTAEHQGFAWFSFFAMFALGGIERKRRVPGS